jgi:hypothetical protein
MLVLPFLLAQGSDPVIVRIQDPPNEAAGIADVLIRAFGFVGVLAVLGVLTRTESYGLTATVPMVFSDVWYFRTALKRASAIRCR